MNLLSSAPQAVRFPLAPSKGETILSYAMRVGIHNLYARPLELLHMLGDERKIIKFWELDPNLLSQVYRQPVEVIAPLLAKPREDGRLVIGERAIAPRDLLRSARRISPAGLRVNGADRFDWAVRQLTFCPANWDMLLGVCPNRDCRWELTWNTRSMFHCGACGYDLRQAPSIKVRKCDRQALQILPDLLSREESVVRLAKSRLPTDLNGLSPEEIFEIIHIVGRGVLAVSDAGVRSGSVSYPNTWIAGVKNLEDPRFIRSIMSGQNRAGLYQTFTDAVRRPIKELSPVAAETFRNFLDPDYHLAPTRSDRFVTVTAAAAQLRIERSAVRSLIQLGHLEVFRATGLERQRQRDLVTAASVASIAHDRVSISTISAEYKIPKAVLLELVGMSVLDVLYRPAFPVIYSEPQIKSSHARAVLTRMLTKIQDRSNTWSSEQRVAVEPLLNRLGGVDQLWANLLWNDLNDKLEYGLSTTCRSSLRLDALLLHPRDAEAIARGDLNLLPGELSQSTVIRLKHAEARLCMHPRDIQVLIRKGKLMRFGKGVSDASVRDALKRFISTREISRLTGIGVYEIGMTAAARGLTRLWPRVGIWDRAAAMTAFADLLGAEDLECAA